jgi:hypothetical protein
MRVFLRSCSVVLIAALALGCGSEVSTDKTLDHTDPPAQAPAVETAQTNAPVTVPSAPSTESASATPSGSGTQDPAAPTSGNNGVGNGSDPAPKGNPPANDGAGSSPGNPDRKDDH